RPCAKWLSGSEASSAISTTETYRIIVTASRKISARASLSRVIGMTSLRAMADHPMLSVPLSEPSVVVGDGEGGDNCRGDGEGLPGVGVVMGRCPEACFLGASGEPDAHGAQLRVAQVEAHAPSEPPALRPRVGHVASGSRPGDRRHDAPVDAETRVELADVV